jgi:putative spermidine/putrescine transport system ATP-binding protein
MSCRACSSKRPAKPSKYRLAGCDSSEALENKNAIIAIRPDDLVRAQPGTPNAFEVDVDVVEYGGRDSLLLVSAPFGKMWARVEGEFAQGERVTLAISPERALIYRPETAA